MSARDAYLRRTYGISEEEYNAILDHQGGVCAICGRAPGKMRLVVDHSHVPDGRVRGLLCPGKFGPACNYHTLGGINGNNPEIHRAAARYLESPPAAALGLDRVVPTKEKKR